MFVTWLNKLPQDNYYYVLYISLSVLRIRWHIEKTSLVDGSLYSHYLLMYPRCQEKLIGMEISFLVHNTC